MGALDTLDKSDLEEYSQKSSKGLTERLAKEYFAKVPLLSCLRLYQIYKFDFVANGYDVQEYLDICGTNVTAHLEYPIQQS